ncbi:IQ motif [Trypanosoma melophagium]|uniref:IQ motif n=1 Tax=Trypanosoma melophagium TaxID=715481 RepID=UPI00351A1D52|nr:IQ motif [Trypanosoma melophagium]
MHGVTYPKAGEKRRGKPFTATAQLPSLETSRQSNNSMMRSQGKSILEIRESPSSSGSRRVKKTHERSGSKSSVPVETVMEMNKKAMALLKDGKMKETHSMLQSALSAAERGVRRFQRQHGESNNETQGQRDAWLLAFAATLSNLGCVRRRDNKLQEAVRYLRDASQIEVQVFGKPSCSTMVNLSAVLLGMGESEEALTIARDCVLASEQSDPMLHIIALHNYGVTLSNHPTEAMRQSAASVLMKALREAQSHLGEEHPTTVLIRERCGMTVHKPSQERSETIPTTTVPVAQVNRNYRRNESLPLPRGRMLPPIDASLIHRKQAKDAINTLDYGEVPVVSPPPPLSLSLPPPLLQSSTNNSTPTAATAAPVEHSIAAGGCNSNGNSNVDCSVHPANNPVADNSSPAAVLAAHADEVSVTPEKVEEEEEEKVSTPIPSSSLTEKNNKNPTNHRTSSPLTSIPVDQTEKFIHAKSLEHPSSSDVPVSVNCESGAEASLLLKSASLHVNPIISTSINENSLGSDMPPEEKTSSSISVDAGAETVAGTAAAALCFEARKIREAEKQEEENSKKKKEGTKKVSNVSDNSRKPSSKKQITRGLIYCGEQEKEGQPSFFRFAPPDTTETITSSEAPAPTGEPNPAYNFPTDGARKDDDDFLDSDDIDEPPVEPKKVVVVEDTEEKAANKIREVLVKTIGINPVKRREERIQREREEEKELRARLRQEAEEAAKKEHFERSLDKIVKRTRERAAKKIQYLWFYWWESVGKRRRELLCKREEDRARRERARKALLEHERRLQEASKEEKATISPQTAVIESVLRCGKKWLLKTACVRYVARMKIPRKDHDNAYFLNKIAKIQATWRGFSTRRRIKDLSITQKQSLNLYREVEVEEYAATVIQLFVRRVFARMEKQRRAVERYGPPTIRIQRWFRSIMPYRRALGLDRISKWRREYSARLIQRAWREYLQRLHYFMERLRYKLDEDRRKERHAANLLKRIGRGFISRQYLSKLHIRGKKLYNVMYSIEWGENDNVEKVPKSNTQLSTQPVYVPTPLEEVLKVAEMEREKYHIGLFVEKVAKREREEWKEALRLRPFEVQRRRAQEDHLCEIELNASRRERAAIKIQTEFRQWLRIRDDPSRDKTLLLIGRGRYQQSYYGNKVERARHLREQEFGKTIFGDQTAPMRAARREAEEELQEIRPLVRTFVPREEVRNLDERYNVEKELKRDEMLVEKQYNVDGMVRGRESRLRRALRDQSQMKEIS